MTQYEELKFRYMNSVQLIDDNGVKGIILFNESKERIMKLFFKFKYSKRSLVEKKTETIVCKKRILTVDRSVYKICIVEFVKFALSRGYDWMLFGQPEWEAIAPKKRKKFIKPKKRKRNGRTISFE